MITRLRNLLGRAVEALPERVSLRLRPSRYRYDLADRPSAPRVPDTRVRLFIGHANYASQGFTFARSAERLPGVGAVNMHLLAGTSVFGFPADLPVPPSVFQHSSHWRRELFRTVSENFTHVIIESAKPLFGKLFDHDVVAEIAALREHGIQVALLAHGSELRLPSRHVQIDEWSPYADGRWPDTPRLERTALHVRSVLERTGAPLFVTTQEMLLDWPAATWLPLAIEPQRWATTAPVLERARPVVVHAPTNPYLKGTALIEPVLERLHDEGVIEYRRLPLIPTHEMPGAIAAADVVLDQFCAGIYSVASVEAMAAGRVTVAHLHDQVLQVVRDRLGLEVPMISATPATLEAALRDMVANPAPYRELAAQGPAFVTEAHDGRATAETLRPFLLGD